MEQELMTIEQPQGISGLMQVAVQSGMNPDGLEKLFALYERDQAIKARQAFSAAMGEFQHQAPVIQKNRVVDTGKYAYKYAELDFIADEIRDLLHEHGLSYRFDSVVTDNEVKVMCIVSHSLGHTETTSFACPVGGMAGANKAQQTASALSYARRYALLLALGLSTGDHDDDARGGVITRAQAAEIEELLKTSGVDRERFLEWLGAESVDDILVGKFNQAAAQLKKRVKK